MTCALCGQGALSGVGEEGRQFCCVGCRTVWHLLSAQKALENYEEHPIWRQAVLSGLISNPNLTFKKEEGKVLKRAAFEIREMWCPSCAEVIEYLVRLEKGVASCHVDYATDRAFIEYDPCQVGEEALFSFIKSLGYDPVPFEGILGKPISFSLYLRFFIAAFCALNVMMLAYPLYATYFNKGGEEWGMLLAWISLAFSLPVLLYSAYPIFQRFFHAMRTGLFGMESLVVAGISAAFILSTLNLFQGNSQVYYDTLTVVVALVLLGKILESKAKFSAKEAFYSLARALPQRARRRGVFLPIKDIAPGDDIEVVAGERIPLDGHVTEGEAWVNEAAMTGEPLSKRVRKGDKVSSGTILETGRLEIAVSGGASSLENIVSSCRINLEHKSAYVRALDAPLRLFVPFVLLFAALIGFFFGFERALATVLISCPCAIGIAAPLVEARLIDLFSKRGAIVRNRGALAKLPDITLFAFDKTGTLTQGEFSVKGSDTLDRGVQRVLKGLSAASEHPLCRALHRHLDVEAEPVTHVFETKGAGIEGGGAFLGSRAYLTSKGLSVPPSEDSETEVFFSFEGKTHRLSFTDEIRPEAPQTLARLPKTLLLSGDRRAPVEAAANLCGIDAWKSELSPLDKLRYLKELQSQGEKVAFTGDGINDAPALSQADIGLAAASSLGLSQAASDLLLTTSLSTLPHLISLAKTARRLIHQNLFWAFFYNLLGLPLAALGTLTPIFAAFAMTASSLFVLLNSLRFRDKGNK